MDGEAVMPLQPLELPAGDVVEPSVLLRSDAVALFVERASGPGGTFVLGPSTAADVAAICRELDGLPLAIELAAARVPVVGLAALRANLHEHVAAVTRSGQPRGDIASTIDWSYQLLGEDERLLWSRLSVFVGGFELDAATEVCGAPPLRRDRVALLVASLVERSLVTRPSEDGARFTMLEVLRRFAAARLVESGQDVELRRRHAAWLGDVSRAVWTNPEAQVRLFARIRANRANLRAALEFWLSEGGDAAQAAELVRNLWAFWQTERPVTETLEVIDRIVAMTPEASAERASALWVSAFLTGIQRDTRSTVERASAAREIGLRLKDPEIVAWALVGETIAALHELRLDDVRALAEDARRLADLMDLAMPALVATYVLASTFVLAGDPRACIAVGAEALRRSEALGEVWVRAYVLIMLAEAHAQVGEPAEASEHARRCLELRLELDDAGGTFQSLELLASMLRYQHQSELGAVLLGCADALGLRIYGSLARPSRPDLDDLRAALRAELGDRRFAAAYRRGAALSPAAALRRVVDDGGSTATPPRVSPGRLSPRELEVARLIADGASNRDAAERLFLSERTVESHVSSIFNKLGIDTRVALVRWLDGLDVAEG